MSKLKNYENFKDSMAMPYLTPDVIDDFVSWLIGHGYDLYSFQISDLKFRRNMFANYMQQSDQNIEQYKLHFPDADNM